MIRNLADVYAQWVEWLQDFWDILQLPLTDALELLGGDAAVISKILEALGTAGILEEFSNLTLLSVILGGAIGVVVVISLFKWFKEIVI